MISKLLIRLAVPDKKTRKPVGYNGGIGTVWKAIKKYGKPDADFWDIKKY